MLNSFVPGGQLSLKTKGLYSIWKISGWSLVPGSIELLIGTRGSRLDLQVRVQSSKDSPEGSSPWVPASPRQAGPRVHKIGLGPALVPNGGPQWYGQVTIPPDTSGLI